MHFGLNVACPQPSHDGGSVWFHTTSPGSAAFYTCGNKRVAIRVCQVDGKWSGVPPKCGGK